MSDIKIRIQGENQQGIRTMEQTQAAAKEMAQSVTASLHQINRAADSSESELKQLRALLVDIAGGIDSQTSTISRAIDQQSLLLSQSLDRVRPAARRTFQGVGEDAQGGSRIAREAFVTASSEIIESWGVDGDIANEIGKFLLKLPLTAKLAVIATGAAFIAGIAAIAAYAAALNQIVEGARIIGTESKEDFDKLAKAAETAGAKLTELDRNSAQAVVKEFEKLKAAATSVFARFLTAAAPQTIESLRILTRLIVENQAAIQSFGRVAGGVLLAFSAGIKTAAENVKLFLFALTSPVGFAIGLPKLFSEFQKNAADAKKEAAEIGKNLPDATFKGDGKNDARLKQIQADIDLLKIYERETERIANAEIASAKRVFDAKAITAEQLAQKTQAAEEKILAAKLATVRAERELIGVDGENANVKRAEINEREEALLQEFRERSRQIIAAKLKDESEAIDRTLNNTRRAAEARLQLRQQLQRISFEASAIRLDTQEINLDRDRANPGNERSEIERQRQLDAARAQLRSEREQAEIQAKIDELQFAEITYAERLELERAFNRELIAERQRVGNELAQTGVDARATSLKTEGFTDEQAKAIAEREALLERATTSQEKFQIALRTTALQLSKDIPSAAAIAARTFSQLGQGFAQAIAAFVSGQASLKQALRQMTGAIFQQLGQVAIAKGAEQFAWALSDLAIGNYAGAAKHFAAGAAWSALGGVVGGIGSAIAGGGSSQAGGGALGDQLTGTRDNQRQQETRFINTERDAQGRTAVQVSISLKTDMPAFVANVEQANLTSFRNDGTARRLIRHEINGEPL